MLHVDYLQLVINCSMWNNIQKSQPHLEKFSE